MILYISAKNLLKAVGKMNEKEYFIYLLSCHLNGKTPIGKKGLNWNEIFLLSKNHSVTGIIMTEIRKLEKEFQPDNDIYSAFNQGLDSTLQAYETKINAIALMLSILTKAKIPHLLIKGAVISNIYPEPALRTSGDTDVIIRESDLAETIDVLSQNGFETDGNSLVYDGNRFDINTELESINVQSKIYFSTPFDDISESSGFTYKLMPIYHLIYVITHIAHHMKIGGSGIRMLMDIDVLVRNYPDMDYKLFWNICHNIHIEKTANTLFALCKKWFKTPVYADFSLDSEENQAFYDDLSSVILDGGTFAFVDDGKVTFFTSIKLLLSLIFPSVEYLKECYLYANKHPMLVPIAWFHRLFKAIFVNKGKLSSTLKEIFKGKELSEKHHQLLTELGLK